MKVQVHILLNSRQWKEIKFVLFSLGSSDLPRDERIVLNEVVQYFVISSIAKSDKVQDVIGYNDSMQNEQLASSKNSLENNSFFISQLHI